MAQGVLHWVAIGANIGSSSTPGNMDKQRYEIQITSCDGSESVLYAERPKCGTRKGRDRQHERVVNQCVEALRDLPAGLWTRLTVTIVPTVTPEQVAQYM